MLEVIEKIVSTKCFKPSNPEFEFKLTSEAAAKNWLVLKKYKLNTTKAIEAQNSTPMRYGSEFRDPSILASLFQHHPNWEHLKSILTNGSSWKLEEIDEETRVSDLDDALAFGNHKGAEKQPDLLTELVVKDVDYGYALALPLSKIKQLPGICMAPVNIAPQNTIDEYGKIIAKDRLTHDQSYEFKSGHSVNNRVIEESLLTCPFAHALRRFINYTVALRQKFPDCRIVCSKIDYKSAFRRMHLNAETAARACIQLPDQDLALMYLRLTFGGKPCPSEWGALSESVCDLTNALLSNREWDPDTLLNPQSLELPEPEFLPDEIKLGKARELVMDIPVQDTGYADVFIDDTFAIVADLPGSDNIKRLERATLLALHTVARPLDDEEPIPRHEMAARNKFIAEAGVEETKMILGWLFDFRQLVISLPTNKHIAWTDELKRIIETGETTAKELETNIGRYVHVAQILPEINHFLNRLRSLLNRAKHQRKVHIPAQCLADCHLILKFLDVAHEGISMNNLVFRLPNRVYRSDSCPHGLGGYSDQGWAWRFYLPPELRFRASNNLLEHISSIITPWIDMLAGRIQPEDCLLSMTDSSTSDGWAHKSNFDTDPIDADCCFDPEEPAVRSEVCRHFAQLCLDNGVRHYSQWFPGRENDVSDALSRDDDRTDQELTNLLYQYVPEQMPTHFEIVPLPNVIASWLTSLLQRLSVKKQLRERHKRTKIGRSNDGSCTPNPSDSATTSSLTDFPDQEESNSWEGFVWLCEREDIRGPLMRSWLRRQSEVPSHMWLRPSGTTTDQTQPETRTASLGAFYQGYTDLLRRKIQRRNSRKLSQQ